MQKSKTLLTTLLSALLIFTPIYPHTAQASATYTLPANLGMEKMTNVAKRRGLTHPAIQLAIEGLVGAIDWIMLEGTVIKYHPKPVPSSEAYERNPKDYVYPVYYHNLKTTITHTDPVRACKVHIWNSYNDPKKYVIGYEFAENGLLSCKFADPRWEHTSSIGWMLAIPKPKEYTLPLEAVLQEVINNAETGNQASIDYLQSVADEIAKEEAEAKAKEREKEEEEDKKKKCLPVTEPNIRMVLEPTTELAIQKSVSLAKLKSMVEWIEKGGFSAMKPIHVYENYIIVDGHHRFISMKLCHMEAPRTPWAIGSADKRDAYPIKNILLDK